MIDRKNPLPVRRQAGNVGISRGSEYYQPLPVSKQEKKVVRMIDRLHLEYPFAGSRTVRDFMCLGGIKVGRKHVATLMKCMGGEALYRKPWTSNPGLGHGYYVHSYGPRLCLSCHRGGLVYTPDTVLENIGHHGGKGSWSDNVFIEHLWRSVKYEDIYLRAYDSVSEAKGGLKRYRNFYNSRRPHSSLDGKTPDQVYFNSLLPIKQRNQ